MFDGKTYGGANSDSAIRSREARTLGQLATRAKCVIGRFGRGRAMIRQFWFPILVPKARTCVGDRWHELAVKDASMGP